VNPTYQQQLQCNFNKKLILRYQEINEQREMLADVFEVADVA
jgi:hypothetical protein